MCMSKQTHASMNCITGGPLPAQQPREWGRGGPHPGLTPLPLTCGLLPAQRPQAGNTGMSQAATAPLPHPGTAACAATLGGELGAPHPGPTPLRLTRGLLPAQQPWEGGGAQRPTRGPGLTPLRLTRGLLPKQQPWEGRGARPTYPQPSDKHSLPDTESAFRKLAGSATQANVNQNL